MTFKDGMKDTTPTPVKGQELYYEKVKIDGIDAMKIYTGGYIYFSLDKTKFSGKKMPFTTLERWCIAAVYAGGLGNMIDRLRLGYVVDMIEVEFIRFPVFNVADCFITCGCILLMLHLIFCNREFWKDEKK